MTRLEAIGKASAGGLLPSYIVPITLLENNDIITPDCRVSISGNITSWHNWTKIHKDSEMIGKTPKNYPGAYFGIPDLT